MSTPKDPDVKKLIDKSEKIKAKMEQNIELLLERGKKLNKLKENATEKLLRGSELIKKEAKELEFQTRWNNYSYYAVAIGAVVGVAAGLIGGFSGIVTALLTVVGAGLGYAGGWLLSKGQQTYSQYFDSPAKSDDVPTDKTELNNTKTYTPSYHHRDPLPSTMDADVGATARAGIRP